MIQYLPMCVVCGRQTDDWCIYHGYNHTCVCSQDCLFILQNERRQKDAEKKRIRKIKASNGCETSEKAKAIAAAILRK